MRYNYLCIEGNIGAGKTSLATRIANQFNAKLILEQFEDNPFLPKFYKEPEKYAFPLELSFLASRFQQLKGDLAKQDLFKSFTVADYFINKSLIFAKRTIKDDELALYTRLFNIINSNLPRPDLLVYLFVSVERLLENIAHRGRDYEKDIKYDYLKSIEEGYFEYIRHMKDIPVLIIDTNNIDFVNKESDYEQMVEIISDVYNPGIHRIVL